MGGGRGSGAERRPRGEYRGERDRSGGRAPANANKQWPSADGPIASNAETKTEDTQPNDQSSGVPTPVTNVAPPKGAWGHNSSSFVGSSTQAQEKAVLPAPEVLADVGSVTPSDPTPAGLMDTKPTKPIEPILDEGFAPLPSSRPVAPAPAPPAGNVWATKGSAHLIQQEAVKQKPPAPRPKRDAANIRNSQNSKPHQPQSHHEQEIISETTALSASVTTDPVVTQEASEIISTNDSQTPIAPSIPTPSDALDAALESLLPASVNGANVNATGWSPRAEPEASATTQIPEMPIGLDPAVPESTIESEKDVLLEDIVNPSVDLSIPISEVDTPVPPPVAQLPTSTVLLGAWDVSGGDDAGLDFGFGSFGNENDVASVEESHQEKASNVTDISASASAAATAMSPARPPPGLSIGGMPPMPANAVTVHELEGKLEGVSLGVSSSQAEDSSKDVSSAPLSSGNGVAPSLTEKSNVSNDLTDATQTSQPQQPPLVSGGHPDSANPMLANQTYGAAYGMGIYNNYGGANVGNGFMGIHAPNPVLGGVLPQQQKLPQQGTNTSQQQGNSQSGIPQHLHQGQQPQGGIYGAPASNGNVGGSEGPASGAADAPSPAGIPPGMPGAMPYNPALFYGQQYYQMGQPHGGVGYGHGYGQFGAGVQSGFGYQQVMGSNGGYGQPYDDAPQHHGSHNNHHSNNSHQNYQKNNHGGSGSGGYRGRNNHHNNSHHGSHNNQYQNQYNPQHGGYGAQPYNMGYGVDQFGNRGGYVPGNMDPYAMQQNNAGYQSGGGHSSGGFSQEDSDHQLSHSKGKSKGGNSRGNNNGFTSGNPNMQQFQQIPPQQQGNQGQQHGFGFQGGASETSNAAGASGSSNSGWSNQGWTGSTWQGGN